jgi:hypothetical protein
MATTTAAITISSSDLTADSLSLNKSTTLLKAGLVTGLDQTSGVGRKIYTQNTVDTVFAEASYDDDKAHKIYFSNPSTTTSEYFTITLGSQVVGRIYAGDFAFIPWNGDSDVKITPSVATTMTLEYLLIFE